MFCDKCGKENPNDATFCEACGNPLNAAPQAPQEPQAPQAPQAAGGFNFKNVDFKKFVPKNVDFKQFNPKNINFKKLDVKSIIMLAIPVVLVLALVISLVSCLGGCGAKGALKDFVNGSIYGKNPKAYMKVTIDPVMMEYSLDEDEFDSKSDILDYIKDELEDVKDRYDERREDHGYSYKYEIKKTYKYSKDEIDALGDWFKETYEDTFGYKSKDIQDAVTFKIKRIVKEDGDKDTSTVKITFVKIKGQWCYKGDLHDMIKELD